MFSWQHNPLVSHPVWSVIPLGHIQHQLKYWDKALDPFIVWVNRCVAWWRMTDQSVDNWQILLWDYRHCRFTLISENERRIEEKHHWIPYIYLSSFSHWGLANVQVRLWGQQLWGNAVKKQKNKKHPCVRHTGLFFSELPSSPWQECWNSSPAVWCSAVCDDGHRRTLHGRQISSGSRLRLCSSLLSFFPFQPPRPTTSPLPQLLFLLPPSFWSIWSIARKPGNQSGRFLLGTTVLLFFFVTICSSALQSCSAQFWTQELSTHRFQLCKGTFPL